MKLQFSHQAYQTRAVEAVVQVFDGQPLAKSDFSLAGQAASVEYANDGSIGNALKLSDEALLSNVQKVQQTNGVSVSSELVKSVSDNGKEAFCPLNFTLEMETGTGKTYTFIKTMYELNKVYGFRKFVVVVPSVAIREGTMKNLQITREHFALDYANVPCVPMLFDSNKLSDLRHFAQSDALSVLVINIDSFTKDSNKINQKGERAFAPIEYIKAVNPIVIVDEPQNFETDIRRRALMELNPLCTLRYSATHKNPYNLLYSLNPVQAYDLGLVKQIEVDGVLADESHNQAFIELVSIDAKAKGISVKVSIDVNEKTGVKRKELTLKLGDDLFVKSKGRDVYADGYILNEIRAEDEEIEFSGGRVLSLHAQQGGLEDDVMRFQIERTVAAHFAKLKNLKDLGVKVLSLFFIDKVANYRAFDADGNPVPGKFAVWFEEAFNKYASKSQYKGLIPHAASAVHNGYFSGDKKGKGAAAKTIWVDTKGNVAKDDDTYALIMKEKERLLSTSEPLQFIFSHSALREGWDNPNVFQICTLNESHSALKKRQEIGRGLRLCVNQKGERVQDKRVNVLTVIPNESYEAFAKALQTEIEEETGVSFDKRVKNARAKARVKRKKLSADEEALFRAIWNKISYQTRYSVKLDTPELIKQCVEALADLNQYPKVQPAKIRALKAKIVMRKDGVHGVETGVGSSDAQTEQIVVPDVYAYIQNRVHLSRSSIFAILDGSGRLGELLINPQAFLDTAIAAIKNCLQALLVKGIEYHQINGRRYEMALFDEELETYLSSVYPPANDDLTTPIHKTLLEAQPVDEDKNPLGDAFTCVLSESDPESQFAHDCSIDERVKFFFKLPGEFKISTPLGSYNPDWAVVFENDARVYFVAETKSSTVTGERRSKENLKIECGREHFKLVPDVVFKDVKMLEQLVV
ncbi:TPA: DEAD/DEAH box helicase family protein [Pseudomonas aeruginosa]|uniref:restriction endonuclease n=1 Tax=Pseudomonas aeruginosa TaxID=287 RepID=UPI000FF13D52|nr:DEAD/DEAH box helicase family protein [Pseudomonas aeruginosa]RPX31990.1 DEAD/DEAH box helicase [Pseudomonas aeruginosa]HCF5960133.1 DEAD/DEAH box helicase family protein [Pseudomonas aeruginosa]HCF5986778.1 DEAD/DEAH box helicase family protein [Pseudomonas aeruginosa]